MTRTRGFGAFPSISEPPLNNIPQQPFERSEGQRSMARRLSALLLGGLTLAGCARSESPSPEPGARPAASVEAPIAVRFARVEVRKLPRVLELTGTLDPDERSEVAAQTSGLVTRTAVDVGTRVKKGDVLIELDSREAALKLAGAIAAAEQQRARLGAKNGDRVDPNSVPEVRSARETRELAARESERAQALAKSGAVSSAEADQAKTAAERAEAQLEAARSGVDQTRAALDAARAQAHLSRKAVTDTRIRAPFDGAIVERRVSPGEFASVGRVVVVLVDDDPLRLRLDVPESEVGAIALSAPVTVSVTAHPRREFAGSVTRLAPSLDPASRTLRVEADIPNEQGLLRPGFFARVRVALTGEPADVLLVPKSAVGKSGTAARVFVRKNSVVTERLLTTGRELGNLVEVRGPLAAGEEVATEAIQQLSDGAEVTAR